MAESSFDIVSEINMQEITNAVDQAKREIANRFDFKGSKSDLTLLKEELVLLSDDEGKMKQLQDVFDSKLIKRGIPLKALQYGNIEQSAGQAVRKKATFVSGLPDDVIKKINKLIKDSKIKVKTQVMDKKIRVTGKSRDDLQQIISLLKENDLPVPLQFVNYK
ncbi:MAG: YajQ family cyclic di-GMP-binding protein [Spirochaetia bacterium]|nr:YajQ family cyclic di-GMP-binding protein [Spirochaetia bacterium]